MQLACWRVQLGCPLDCLHLGVLGKQSKSRMVPGVDQLRHFGTCARGYADRLSLVLRSALRSYWLRLSVHTKN